VNPVPSPQEPRARLDVSPECRRRFAAQDVQALAEVYDRYSRAVWAVAMSVTRAEHLAQEAVQETFLRAWRVADGYDPRRDLGPWLMTVARHASLDLVRREFRPTRGGHEAEQDVVVDDPGIERIWTAWQVKEALDQLDEAERQIIRLAFYEDLTQTQIAERLGVPLGTVKSRSARAHRRLAGLLTHLRGHDRTEENPGADRNADETREAPPRRNASMEQPEQEGGGR
jgi:RNA polymerase sigma-70 factor, ECF subfamily